MQSMDEIYRTHSTLVYRYLLRMTGDADISEELTQETFYQAVKSIGRYDESCKITTWLCAIARNQLGKYRRRHRAEEICDECIADSEPGVEAVLVGKEQRVELMKAMRRLPDITREVMYLRAFGGMSFAEIGEVMEKSENWARVTYYRGKVKLREEIDGDDFK